MTSTPGLTTAEARWGAGCAFLDYDRDGLLDILAANYIDLDSGVHAGARLRASAATRESRSPAVRPGCPAAGTCSIATRGRGTFEDVSEKSGIAKARGTYGLGVATVDFDADGWIDVYVANDSNPSALYRNNRDGTFTDIGVTAGCAYSQDGKPQAGMGIAVGDYDRNGTMDIFKTNFAGDTSTLYANTGDGLCEDRTFAGGIGLNTRWLGWGVGFLDLDGDGWLDLFLVNGHVYPEVERIKTEAGYKQRKVVYQNLRNGRFADVTEQLGPPVTTPKASRGAAFADFDNDGDVDVVDQQRARHAGALPARSRRRSALDRPSSWSARRRTAARSARGSRCRRRTACRFRKSAAAAATTRRTICALHFGLGSASAVSSASRCAGRTAARNRGPASPSIASTR